MTQRHTSSPVSLLQFLLFFSLCMLWSLLSMIFEFNELRTRVSELKKKLVGQVRMHCWVPQSWTRTLAAFLRLQPCRSTRNQPSREQRHGDRPLQAKIMQKQGDAKHSFSPVSLLQFLLFLSLCLLRSLLSMLIIELSQLQRYAS